MKLLFVLLFLQLLMTTVFAASICKMSHIQFYLIGFIASLAMFYSFDSLVSTEYYDSMIFLK